MTLGIVRTVVSVIIGCKYKGGVAMSKLQDARKAAGLSQSKLAEVAGINLRILQYYEQGKNDINKAQALTVYKLARALNVNIEDILEID